MPVLSALALLALAKGGIAREAAGLTIENIEADATVRTRAILLRGKAPEAVVRLKGAGPETEFPVVNGQWAGIVELKPGANMVAAKCGRSLVRMRVNYRPAKDPYTVRAVYLLASDEEPGYIGNNRATEADVRARFVTMAETIQAFAAEALAEGGYERKAFTLATDPKGNVAVDFVRLDRTGDELRKLDGQALYNLIEPTLGQRYDYGKTKIIALMGFTRYDVATQTKLAHTALGGGGLALFGSGPLRFWPTSIAGVPRAFGDGRRIDPKVEFDDSGLRERAWANAATTYGACLHELGHAFGLPHSPDPRCIMSRGFDQINRAWDLREPNEGAPDNVFTPDTRSHWDPAWAMRLDLSPWFQPDGPPAPSGDAPKIEIKDGRISLSGTDLRVFGYWAEGPNFGVTQVFSAKTPPGLPPFEVSELLKILRPGEKLHLYAIDRFGRDVDIVANP